MKSLSQLVTSAPRLRVILALLVLAWGTPAIAAEDAAKGEILADTCMGCHGIRGYRNVYPSYSVPRLQGQHADYIIAALKAYKSGQRDHKTMQVQAMSLTDQEIAHIAAYLSSLAAGD